MTPGAGPARARQHAAIFPAAFIGLGSNLGNRVANLERALAGLADLGAVLAASQIYETEPWGVSGPQPRYLNQVVKIRAGLAPENLLTRLLQIEVAMGRRRTGQSGPRLIDLDLLLYGNAVIRRPGLVVPHPRMHLRAFVLVPLAEIAPNVVIPGTGKTAGELAGLVGSEGVRRLDLPTLQAGGGR